METACKKLLHAWFQTAKVNKLLIRWHQGMWTNSGLVVVTWIVAKPHTQTFLSKTWINLIQNAWQAFRKVGQSFFLGEKLLACAPITSDYELDYNDCLGWLSIWERYTYYEQRAMINLSIFEAIKISFDLSPVDGVFALALRSLFSRFF